MSNTHPIGPSSSNFQLIFNNALKAYEKQTNNDILFHPLAADLQACQSPSAILAVLLQQVQEFDQSRTSDERLTKWLGPTVNVLYAFSETIGESVSLVFSPAKVIFAGFGVLLSAAKDVRSSQETLIDIFERIENFFRRLEVYTAVPPTPEMMDIMVKIMVEVLSILGTATKEIRQNRTKKYLKRLAGRTDLEDALKKLDKLTHEEARMATAQNLKATHVVDDRVKGVDAKVDTVGGEVMEVNDKVTVLIDDERAAKVVIERTANDVDQVKRSQLRQDLHRWLSPSDPSTNHNIACGCHHEGTAEWFFQGSIFREWKISGSLLWIHGKPGSGKSILCSTIIKDITSLHDSGLGSLAYFYYDFRDTTKQNRRDLLPSLVIQLSARSDPYCDILSSLHAKHDCGAKKPSEDALMKCLKSMVALPDQPPVYIIIDALDECPDSSGLPTPREQVLDVLKDLVELSLSNLHLCVTSRPEIDIRNALEPLTSRRVSLHDQTGQKKDIVSYVTSIVHSDSKMRRWRGDDKRLVIETLSEKADGMFRWVFCQLEALRHCFPTSVRHMLKELPKSLDETYERILMGINKANQQHANRLLQCLTVAVRPLRVSELAEVLAVDFGTASGSEASKLETDWRWEDQEDAILSTCSSLISVVDEDKDASQDEDPSRRSSHFHSSRAVQFSHFSVKEYLTSPRLSTSNVDVSGFHIHLEPAHTIMARACLSTLLRLDDISEEEDVMERFPLARYAAEHWVTHAQFNDVSSRIREGMEILLDPDKPYFSAWIRIYDIDVKPHFSATFGYFSTKTSDAAPLYYAALCGFHDLAEHLINKCSQEVDATGGEYVSALVAALAMGHFEIAELLYQHGAQVNVEGFDKSAPLFNVSYNGHLEIAKWLLRHGADPNLRDKSDGWSALRAAAKYGHLEVVKTLLQHNADPNIKDRHGATPLLVALKAGKTNVALLLLEQGADVNARSSDGSTPLHLVSKDGRLEVARALIEHGADRDAEDNEGKTPFEVALESDMKKLLLDRGSK